MKRETENTQLKI